MRFEGFSRLPLISGERALLAAHGWEDHRAAIAQIEALKPDQALDGSRTIARPLLAWALQSADGCHEINHQRDVGLLLLGHGEKRKGDGLSFLGFVQGGRLDEAIETPLYGKQKRGARDSYWLPPPGSVRPKQRTCDGAIPQRS
jgi:hypothetical protein